MFRNRNTAFNLETGQAQLSSWTEPESNGLRETLLSTLPRICSNCRFYKEECDGSQPCSRCQLDNAACVFESLRGVRFAPSESTQEASTPDTYEYDDPNKLRYHVILNAPTAMVKRHDDIPVTYLNMGQAYSICVTDLAQPAINPSGASYRICVRICFDDAQQRIRPVACWQLWRDGRGANEMHKRGGRFQAVEFVERDAADGFSDNADIELESVNHDGFSVIWRTSKTAIKECSMLVRLNFLSTDFSHSKGVRGIPVRLCVKTKLLWYGTPGVNFHPERDILASEICYCKVKMFRDHGAERKLSNDVAHVKMSIGKIEKGIANTESSGIHHRSAKRKRNDSDPSLTERQMQDNTVRDANEPARLNVHHRRFSSGSLVDGEPLNDLKASLATLQDMLMSTRPISVLDLRGEDIDDPDLYPVSLSQDNLDDYGELYRRTSRGSRGNQSPVSLHSQNSRGSSPPRASSIGASGGHITPNTIPFQAFQSDAYQDEIYRPFALLTGGLKPISSMSSVNEYHYIAMQPEDVRLMVLYPGKSEDPVSCGLKVMPLDRLKGSQLVYQALSYAWGSETDLRQIWIEDVQVPGNEPDDAVAGASNANPGPQKFYVRLNLHSALRRLRSEVEELWFWIDAICIDQQNLVEKGHQLPKMLDIYCNAWSVCIWLGEPEEPYGFGTNEPLDLIGTIINLKLLDHIVEAPGIDDHIMLSLIAFAKLLKRPWFRRRWVIQEISSSTRASVQYGNNKVNWIDFADAVQLFVLKLDRIRELYRGSRLFERDADALSHVEAAGASAIVQATNDVLRKSEDGRIVARLCDIETLVMRFVHFEASDPRDTVLALWSLADMRIKIREGVLTLDVQRTISPLSYMEPCESIYVDFVCYCIEQHGSLDVICRHWALPLGSDPGTELPTRLRSWIGTTANSPFGMHLGSGGRMNGDSLVGAPGRKVYNTSGRSLSGGIASKLTSSSLGVMLRVTGYVISFVSQVSPRMVDAIIPYDALRLLGWTNRNSVDNISDRMWRTLVADRTIDGSKAPSWWRRASMFALSMASRDGDLQTQKLLQNKSLPQTVREYLHRVQARWFGTAEFSP